MTEARSAPRALRAEPARLGPLDLRVASGKARRGHVTRCTRSVGANVVARCPHPARAAPSLRLLPRARGVDVRCLRAPSAGARAAALRPLRDAHGARPARLPRVCPVALADQRALGGLAGGPGAAARRPLEARRDLACPAGRRPGGARDPAARGRGDRRGSRRGRQAVAALRPAGRAGQELARGWAVACRSAATRAARAQRGLDAGERRRNVRGAFAAGAGPGAVVLVDDVYTTGATADECARRCARQGPSTCTS